MIGGKEIYIPANRKLLITKGSQLKRGPRLTTGPINPHELLEKVGIDAVRAYITDEVSKIYRKEGIKRRNIEVVAKGMTNLGKVTDPGDSGFIRGDYIQLSHADALNRKAGKKAPIKVEPVLRGLETLPLDQTTDWVARLQYRRLKETYIRAANEGWESDIHGVHPAPGIAYGAEFGKSKGKGPY